MSAAAAVVFVSIPNIVHFNTAKGTRPLLDSGRSVGFGDYVLT